MLPSDFFKDFSKVAQGTISTVNAIREEVDIIIRQRLERLLTSKGLVTKEDHDVAIERIYKLENEINALKAILNNKKINLANSSSIKKSKKIIKKPANKK